MSATFVVRRCAMQDAEQAVALEHDRVPGDTTFQLSFFSLAAIDEQLDRAVDSPAAATAAAHNSPPRLLLPEPSKRG